MNKELQKTICEQLPYGLKIIPKGLSVSWENIQSVEGIILSGRQIDCTHRSFYLDDVYFILRRMAENKRKPLSKKVRFEVFKRDNFTCQYCSRKPPSVPLEVDHILPVSKRGTNHIDNLLTACFDCNRGKSNIELDCVPDNLQTKIERKKIAQKQYKEYLNPIISRCENLISKGHIQRLEIISKENFNQLVEYFDKLGNELIPSENE